MQSSYFPMFVDISDKNIVVIGGGKIAARRVNTLLMFTQRLTIVSPFLCEELQSVQGKIHWIPCEYTQECLRGMDIVLAATNQRVINHLIGVICLFVVVEGVRADAERDAGTGIYLDYINRSRASDAAGIHP